MEPSHVFQNKIQVIQEREVSGELTFIVYLHVDW